MAVGSVYGEFCVSNSSGSAEKWTSVSPCLQLCLSYQCESRRPATFYAPTGRHATCHTPTAPRHLSRRR